MTTDTATLEDLQLAVVGELQGRGLESYFHHSGGGVYGVLVALKNGDQLFGTLDGGAWVGLEWTDEDGELVANLELQVRPHGPTYGSASSASAITAAIHDVARRIRGREWLS